jgi:hypothetical protein
MSRNITQMFQSIKRLPVADKCVYYLCYKLILSNVRPVIIGKCYVMNPLFDYIIEGDIIVQDLVRLAYKSPPRETYN